MRGSKVQGRKWKNPFEVPVIMAQQLRGTNVKTVK